MKCFCLMLLLAMVSATSFAQANTAKSNNPINTNQASDTAQVNKQDTTAYATLYFYRSFVPKMVAPMKKVPIYFNDSLVHNLKANMIVAFKVTKEGRYRIATDEKGENLLLVRIKMGQEYFFKCDIEAGLWFGKPTIQPVTPKIGRAESGVLEEEQKKTVR